MAILSWLWGISLPGSALVPSPGLAKLRHRDGHEVCAAPADVYGVAAALKDEPHAWLWRGLRPGWPGGLACLQLLHWFPCWAGGLQPERPPRGQQKGRTGGLLPSRAATRRDISTIGKTGQQRQPGPGGGGRAAFPGVPGRDLGAG